MASLGGKEKKSTDTMIKTRTLKEILEKSLDIVCSQRLLQNSEQFHESFETLIQICHINTHFTYELGGTGFTNIPLLIYLCESEYSKDILHLVQPPPVQRVLCLFSHSTVLKDPTTVCQKRMLPFYVSQKKCKLHDRVQLYITSKTHGQMLGGDYGLNFTEKSTFVEKDHDQTVRFFLSSKNFQEVFIDSFPKFLSCFKPTLAEIYRPKLHIREGETYQHQILDDLDKAVDLYLLDAVPALCHPDWPEKAFEWLTRKRPSNFPSKELVREISSKGCHLIPPTTNKDAKDRCQEESEWLLCFDVAEKMLLQKCSVIDKQAAFLFRSVMYDRQCVTKRNIGIDHIKAVLLWTFEEREQQNDVLVRLIQIASKFMEFLAKGNCPHYFIPNRNLFDDIPIKELENTRDVMDTLVKTPWIVLLHCHLLPYVFYDKRAQLEGAFFAVEQNKPLQQQTLDDFSNWCQNLQKATISQIEDSLAKSFNDTIRLFVISLCSKVNYVTLEESIIYHRETLRLAQDCYGGSEFIAPVASILCSNLACLYNAKGLDCSGKREREYYLIKAESLLKDCVEIDLTLCRTRLANFYFTTRRYNEAITLLESLQDILDHAEVSGNDDAQAENSDSDKSDKIDANKSGEFKKLLWSKWLNGKFSFDIIYSISHEPLCPSVMKHALKLAKCTALGMQQKGTAIFTPLFHGRFLLALCYAQLQHYDKAKAILLGIEAVLCHPQMVKVLESSVFTDVNEKRMAGYYIILGECFLSIGEHEKAKAAFSEAYKIFPTFRNPANWLYLSVKCDEAVNDIAESAKALVLERALTFTFNFMTSQLQ